MQTSSLPVSHQGEQRVHAKVDGACIDERHRQRPSPTHVAFVAESRLAVRQCYAAALNAGGYSSGAPGYCDAEQTSFNAAVEDLDGNVLEIVYREEFQAHDDSRSISRNELSSQIKLHEKSAEEPTEMPPVIAESRVPTRVLRRAWTEPSKTESQSKALLVTLLGAAAGVAVAYAMRTSERDSAQAEREFDREPRSRSKRPTTAIGVVASRGLSKVRTSKSRNYDQEHSLETEVRLLKYRRASAGEVDRRARESTHNTLAIESTGYASDDEAQGPVTRYTNHARPELPRRSQTYDVVARVPHEARHSQRSHGSTTRSSEVPTSRPNYYLEAGSNTRGSRLLRDVPENRAPRYLPPLSARSGPRYISDTNWDSKSNASRRRTYDREDDAIPYGRRDSVHSSSSYRTARTSGTQRESRRDGQAAYDESAAGVPLPSSRAPSGGRRSRSRHNIRSDDGSDGLSDDGTVVPGDSISCVDLSRPKRPKSIRSGMQHDSRRSEASSERTVRPSLHSRHSAATTLPVRSKYEREKGSSYSVA